jgi:superfamily II DNA or RNA helicase
MDPMEPYRGRDLPAGAWRVRTSRKNEISDRFHLTAILSSMGVVGKNRAGRNTIDRPVRYVDDILAHIRAHEKDTKFTFTQYADYQYWVEQLGRDIVTPETPTSRGVYVHVPNVRSTDNVERPSLNEGVTLAHDALNAAASKGPYYILAQSHHRHVHTLFGVPATNADYLCEMDPATQTYMDAWGQQKGKYTLIDNKFVFTPGVGIPDWVLAASPQQLQNMVHTANRFFDYRRKNSAGGTSSKKHAPRHWSELRLTQGQNERRRLGIPCATGFKSLADAREYVETALGERKDHATCDSLMYHQKYVAALFHSEQRLVERLLVAHGTGLGKTETLLLAMAEAYASTTPVAIIVPSHELRVQLYANMCRSPYLRDTAFHTALMTGVTGPEARTPTKEEVRRMVAAMLVTSKEEEGVDCFMQLFEGRVIVFTYEDLRDVCEAPSQPRHGWVGGFETAEEHPTLETSLVIMDEFHRAWEGESAPMRAMIARSKRTMLLSATPFTDARRAGAVRQWMGDSLYADIADADCMVPKCEFKVKVTKPVYDLPYTGGPSDQSIRWARRAVTVGNTETPERVLSACRKIQPALVQTYSDIDAGKTIDQIIGAIDSSMTVLEACASLAQLYPYGVAVLRAVNDHLERRVVVIAEPQTWLFLQLMLSRFATMPYLAYSPSPDLCRASEDVPLVLHEALAVAGARFLLVLQAGANDTRLLEGLDLTSFTHLMLALDTEDANRVRQAVGRVTRLCDLQWLKSGRRKRVVTAFVDDEAAKTRMEAWRGVSVGSMCRIAGITPIHGTRDQGCHLEVRPLNYGIEEFPPHRNRLETAMALRAHLERVYPKLPKELTRPQPRNPWGWLDELYTDSTMSLPFVPATTVPYVPAWARYVVTGIDIVSGDHKLLVRESLYTWREVFQLKGELCKGSQVYLNKEVQQQQAVVRVLGEFRFTKKRPLS